jgi:CheY-like chemotaxis protein
MPKLVLDVGNCTPDHQAIRQLIEGNFDAKVLPAQGAEDTLRLLAEQTFAMVLVNRKLDRDYSDGTEIIRQIKGDERFADIPVMLVTNYDEHQQAAMKLGALRGFGKLDLGKSKTIEQLRGLLPPKPSFRSP